MLEEVKNIVQFFYDEIPEYNIELIALYEIRYFGCKILYFSY